MAFEFLLMTDFCLPKRWGFAWPRSLMQPAAMILWSCPWLHWSDSTWPWFLKLFPWCSLFLGSFVEGPCSHPFAFSFPWGLMCGKMASPQSRIGRPPSPASSWAGWICSESPWMSRSQTSSLMVLQLQTVAYLWLPITSMRGPCSIDCPISLEPTCNNCG